MRKLEDAMGLSFHREKISVKSNFFRTKGQSLLWLTILFFLSAFYPSNLKADTPQDKSIKEPELIFNSPFRKLWEGESPKTRIAIGDRFGYFMKYGSNMEGPSYFTLSGVSGGNMTFLEPVPFKNHYEVHTFYGYYPYEANTSNDPEKVHVKSIPAIQQQQGNTTDHLEDFDFNVSVPVSAYAGDSFIFYLTSLFSYFEFQISSNADGIIVNEIQLKAEGSNIAFTDGTVNITKPAHDPEFALVKNIQGGSSEINLEITNGGLSIPNSQTVYASGYMGFNPFNASFKTLDVTVKTNKGDFTYQITGENYNRGTKYVIPIYLEIASPPPVYDIDLQWSVSTSGLNSFVDVGNNQTTLAEEPGPVYLQIRPEVTGNLDFDSWEITYSTQPGEYHSAMSPTDKALRYTFNDSNPHTQVGNYVYTVSEAKLYKNGAEVGSATFDQDPYVHSIKINKKEEPVPPFYDIALQWSVSRTNGEQSSYVDVDNLQTTVVNEPGPVYLQIRPIVTGDITFDSWEIEYASVPEEYEFKMDPISGSSRYTFNEGRPHTKMGTYKYTVTQVRLYRQGIPVGYQMFYTDPYIHTIVINKEITPNPEDWITLRPIPGFCADEKEIRIPFDLRSNLNLEYSIVFSEAAKNAGFEDVPTYSALPVNGYFTVPVNSVIPKGKYNGNILLRQAGTTAYDAYPFEVEVYEEVQITKQPSSVSILCKDDEFMLTVEAKGTNLTYQWYYNDKKIEGATSATYTGTLTEKTEGLYYVEVSGYCGMEISDKVSLNVGVAVLIKWDDVLYITNTDNRYIAFQWYKDGMAISKDGTAIYYTDPVNGLEGTYHVRAYYNDKDYVESCPMYFSTRKISSQLSVYPNVVKMSNNITIESNELGETYIGAKIELFNIMGKKVYTSQITDSRIEIPMNYPSGAYILHITALNGKKTVEKIIIN